MTLQACGKLIGRATDGVGMEHIELHLLSWPQRIICDLAHTCPVLGLLVQHRCPLPGSACKALGRYHPRGAANADARLPFCPVQIIEYAPLFDGRRGRAGISGPKKPFESVHGLARGIEPSRSAECACGAEPYDRSSRRSPQRRGMQFAGGCHQACDRMWSPADRPRPPRCDTARTLAFDLKPSLGKGLIFLLLSF
jgi:hypothetical protein